MQVYMYVCTYVYWHIVITNLMKAGMIHEDDFQYKCLLTCALGGKNASCGL